MPGIPSIRECPPANIEISRASRVVSSTATTPATESRMSWNRCLAVPLAEVAVDVVEVKLSPWVRPSSFSAHTGGLLRFPVAWVRRGHAIDKSLTGISSLTALPFGL